jgi:large subunit ribosomal protein L10
MNRDQKSVAIAEIASHIDESDAIFAVDYRGITVEQVAELRAKLRESDATFKVVKNSLTERAADQVGAESLKDYLSGPTALTFVRGDIATAAKAIADYARATQLLPFKGGLMEGATLDVDQIRSLSRLPSRDVLYGQLVGVVASPVSGLVRSLGGLLGGLAVALGQVRQKKQSGEIPAGNAPAAEAPAAAGETAEPEQADAQEPVAQEPAAEEPAADAPEPDVAKADEPAAEDEPPEELAKAEETAAAAPPKDKTEPENDEPALADDNQTDVSADRSEIGQQPEDAETNPTKED